MFNRSVLIGAGVLCALSHAALGQVNQWDSGGVGGLWSDVAPWTLGHAPLAGETAYIGDGSVVELNGIVTPQLSGVHTGPGFGTVGGLKIMSGTLNTGNCLIAAINEGSLQLGGTGAINCTSAFGIAVNNGTAVGTAIMSGGSITAPVFYIANSGIGSLEMTDGLIDASTTLIMANNPNTDATFAMSGGLINSGNFNYANSGTGSFTLSGGEINTGIFYGGNNATGTATVLIQGGALNASTFRNSGLGKVSTRQTDGVVTVGTLSLALGNGIGYYSLLGGELEAYTINRGTTATYAFNMSGGRLNNTFFGEWSKNMDLKPTGGTIVPGGDFNSSMFLRGDLALGTAATIEFTLPGDKIVMQDTGTVELNGLLSVILTSAPPISLEYLLIDNDDADPVIGSFAGLPEGATLPLAFGGSPYPMTLSYVGGDGNDVVLIYNDCPIDFTNDGVLDNGDIGAFVTLFLSGDMSADVNNDGVLDNGDINAFVAAFLAGC
ncbi:MAG: hypothetical protein ACI89L_002609 [Phycisphaerales bacterium]|jgi:hypothetical protein